MEFYVTLDREEVVKDQYIIEKTLEGMPMACAVFFRSAGMACDWPVHRLSNSHTKCCLACSELRDGLWKPGRCCVQLLVEHLVDVPSPGC